MEENEALPARRPRILLVDDDSAVCGLVRRILGPSLFELLEAHSVDGALALASTTVGPVDLLLTDVVMPRSSGTALAAQLRERWGDLRVLYMSGYGRQVLAGRGLVDEDAFLKKPFTASALREGVEHALGGRG